MNSRILHQVVRVLVTLAAIALLLLIWHRPARSACTYYGMYPVTTYGINQSPEIIRFHPSRSSWMVMATRPDVSGEDWDLRLYANTAPDPTCVTDLLASSTYGGSVVDFVIGDYTHDPFADAYAYFTRFSGTVDAYAQWRDTSEALVAQGPIQYRTWSVLDLAETFNVTLTAGTTYTLYFTHDPAIDAKLLVFRNPGSGTYWASRSYALLSATGTASFTAPATGDYALVAVNDNGGAGAISVGVGLCATPTALASGTAAWTGDAYHDWSFTPTTAYWGAVGVLATGADYDVEAYRGTAGTGYPACLSDGQAYSGSVGAVDLVAVDFNHTPWATTYANTPLFTGQPGAQVEWVLGNSLLGVDNVPMTPTFSATQFLKTWDVALAAGTTYHFVFEPTGANLHLLLFRNPASGSYFAGRATAVFDVTGCTTYTAPATDYYGVMVVDDDGASGSCLLGVNALPCICPKELANNVPTASTAPNDYFAFTPVYHFWSVAAVRAVTTSDDWDVALGNMPTGEPAPTCIGNQLASSSQLAGVVDFVAIDYNLTPLARAYLRSQRFSGSGSTGIVQWVGTVNVVEANGPPVSRTQAPGDLADVYDAYMTASWPYRIIFTGSPGQKLLVFENGGGGTWIVPRSSTQLIVSGGSVTFTPTLTGYHAFVVVNDNGAGGNFTIQYGACRTPTPLASGTVSTALLGYSDYSFNQVDASWTAIGVRSTGPDWDLVAAAGLTGPFPTCVGPLLASSTYYAGAADIVVGDFHHNAPGTYYAEAYQFTPGSMIPSTVEWDAGTQWIQPNDNNAIERVTGSADVLECWDLHLSAGYTYTFSFSHLGGADLHMLLFGNYGGGTYWAGRSSALLDLPVAASSATFTPSMTGEYGVVVVNDNGAADTYDLSVKACFTTTTLTSRTTYYASPEMFTSFAQSADYWSAVGVRGSSDWDIGVYQSGTGGPPGECFSSPLAFSTQSGTGVDLVVGDFNSGSNLPGTYYVRPYRFAGTSTGAVQWDDGLDLIAVGSPPVHRTVSAGDVVEIWDVALASGGTYGLFFPHTGTADLKLLLFRNPGATYWAPRSARVLESTTHATYTAPASDYYGLAVVNDNGGTGSYDLGVYLGGVSVDAPPPPGTSGIRSLSPNPARGTILLEYGLHEAANVRVELLDMAGRRIGTLEEGFHDAGVWHASWSDAERTAPGIYVVRLVLDGRTVGQRKVVFLR